MIFNYIKIALRSLWKQRVNTFINILGLTIGITSFILITLFVNDELSYDTYSPYAKNTYRFCTKAKVGDEFFNLPYVGAPAAEALKYEFPEIKKTVRLLSQGNFVVDYNDISFNEKHVIFTDPDFFDVFGIHIIKGNPQTALAEPNSVVITEATAKKYFGEQDPIGKMITLGSLANYEVTGVCEEIPGNTHFHYNIFASLVSLPISRDPYWIANNFYTYVVLNDGANPEDLEAKFPQLIRKYVVPEIKELLNMEYDKFLGKDGSWQYFLQPVGDIHLRSDLRNELEPNGDIDTIYIFLAIGFLLILISSINYINLSTAGSIRRAKEVGVRKSLGSTHVQLIKQFLIESVLLTFFAVVISIAVAYFLLPEFNTILNKQIAFTDIFHVEMMLYLLLICVVVGVVAGSFPAFYIAALNPSNAIKGKMRTGTGIEIFRSSLIVVQFCISILLIVGTTIVYKQLNFMLNTDLGYKKDRIIVLGNSYRMGEGITAFKNELLRNPQIQSVSVSGFLPVRPSDRSINSFRPEGTDADNNVYPMQFWTVDHDYIKTMGMQLIQGRDFSKEFPDNSSVIINEVALKQFGWDDPIGKYISEVTTDPQQNERLQVVGVVKNFYFESLRKTISPVVLRLGQAPNSISIKATTDDYKQLISSIESTWKKYTSNPLEYTFLEDQYFATYKTEQKTGSLLKIFAIIAITIACLGLYGLAAYLLEQRVKEIGVRKVLGASKKSILFLFLKQFSKLILFAIILALPITFFSVNKWLESFVYRISFDFTFFLGASLLVLTIALLTVTFHALKAANLNPVKSIRNE